MRGSDFYGELRLVPNSRKYWDFIRELRNHRAVQSGFITKSNISEEQQKDYMSKHGECFFIAVHDGVPCGFIGVIEDDIRFCTHPLFQGKRVGTFLLENVRKHFPNAKGRVKKSNFASIKCFNNAGVPYVLIDD